MDTENLNVFFSPKAIAVVGASDREDSIGGKIFRNLAGQYNGQVFPVNPFKRNINGITAFPTVEKLPSKTDLAIIATPAHTIPQIVEECGRAAITNIIIVSAGFEKNVADAKNLNQRILELKRAYKLRIIGPNSFGVIRPKAGLYATFGDKKAIPGKIAFISQSAALCGLVLDWSYETQVGLSAVVSVGDSMDVDTSDLVDYFGEDSQTRIIMLCFEDTKNIRAFMSASRGFARTKPIVLIKIGRSTKDRDDSGVEFNYSVEEDAIFDAAFRRVGVVRVNTVTELLALARALSMQPNPNENCLTIVTNASGPGTMAVDELRARGGELWKPGGSTMDSLKNILPYYCRVSNPIDVLEEANPERFKRVLQVCLDDPTVRSLLLIYTSLGTTGPLCMANIVIDAAAQKRKTLLIVIMGKDQSCQEARKLLNRNGIPAFETPEEAVSTFIHMYAYTKNLELLYQTPEEFQLTSEVPAHLRGIIRRALREGRHSLSLPESFSFLDAYKIQTLKSRIAPDAEQAKHAASEIGFPVRMQSLYSPLPTKSLGESFCCDVASLPDVEIAYNTIVERMRNSVVSAEFQGVLLQPIPRTEGVKLFAGSRKDPKFGSIILFGVSGFEKTHAKAISIGFPPLNQVLARQIVDNLDLARCANTLPKDRNIIDGTLEETLVRLSQVVIDFPELGEIYIDPLILCDNRVYAEKACITIDRDRVMREASDHHEHLVIAPYPRKYITIRTLKNDMQVKLRPIKPEDENRFNELFRSLSEESIRLRFFETIKELSHDTLTRYCNLDYDREIAIVAELQDDKKIIGIVRILPDLARKTAEFAIMVGDEWQGLGLGSKLMDTISDVAKDMKLQEIHSYVSRANIKMIRLCTKKGFETEPMDEYIINMSKKLSH